MGGIFGERERRRQPGEDHFMNLGGLGSFFKMFFNAASDIGGVDHNHEESDDHEEASYDAHPMTKGRQGKMHFHHNM